MPDTDSLTFQLFPPALLDVGRAFLVLEEDAERLHDYISRYLPLDATVVDTALDNLYRPALQGHDVFVEALLESVADLKKVFRGVAGVLAATHVYYVEHEGTMEELASFLDGSLIADGIVEIPRPGQMGPSRTALTLSGSYDYAPHSDEPYIDFAPGESLIEPRTLPEFDGFVDRVTSLLTSAADPVSRVAWAMETFFGTSPFDGTAKLFVGDWDAMYQTGQALQYMASWMGFAEDTVTYLKGRLLLGWDGPSAQQAEEYLAELGARLEAPRIALHNCGQGYMDTAIRVAELGQLVSSLLVGVTGLAKSLFVLAHAGVTMAPNLVQMLDEMTMDIQTSFGLAKDATDAQSAANAVAPEIIRPSGAMPWPPAYEDDTFLDELKED